MGRTEKLRLKAYGTYKPYGYFANGKIFIVVLNVMKIAYTENSEGKQNK
jgi:hypothetical protein